MRVRCCYCTVYSTMELSSHLDYRKRTPTLAESWQVTYQLWRATLNKGASSAAPEYSGDQTSPRISISRWSKLESGHLVRASSLFVPEIADLQGSTRQFYFAYSIRMSLLPEGCSINGMTFNFCQLVSRHWIIHANDVVVADVNGEGVIGKFPLLRPGDQEFVYESCTPLPSSSGFIEGSFMFVPGRLGDAKCSAFEVLAAQFPLQLPDYIF